MKRVAVFLLLCLLLSGCGWHTTSSHFVAYDHEDGAHVVVAKSFANAGVAIGYAAYGAAIAAVYVAPYAVECLCHLH